MMNTIVKYKLPVITLDKSTPREAVCKVFENVNTGGVPLTVFELVTATYATQEFDLRKDWKKCRKQIQGIDDTLRTDLLDGIDETTLFNYSNVVYQLCRQTGRKGSCESCKL